MTRLLLALAATAVLAGCAPNGPPLRPGERDRRDLLTADPSKVIAAELAFARMTASTPS